MTTSRSLAYATPSVVVSFTDTGNNGRGAVLRFHFVKTDLKVFLRLFKLCELWQVALLKAWFIYLQNEVFTLKDLIM